MDEPIDEPKNQSKSWIKSFLVEVFKFALIIIFVIIPFRIFVAQPYIVSGESMSPTFADGDYLIVDQLTYRLRDPHRGDVIILHPPHTEGTYFTKRVIGLPGETVSINQGNVTIIKADGTKEPLNETYIKLPKYETANFSVPQDSYFVMGDNRAGSYDSRAWGVLERDKVAGRPFLRLFPLKSLDIWPGE